MEKGIAKDTFLFLEELKANNDRTWFEKNKHRYVAAKDQFAAFLEALHLQLSEQEPLPALNVKKAVFRIYRDVRFSKNKDPYKTNIGGIIHRADEWTKCPLYIHIEPGGVFVGGGIWEPPTDLLKKIRQEIDYNPEPLVEVLHSKDFKTTFGEMQGEKLKKAPQGYDVEHKSIELLRHKQFLISKKFEDKEAMSDFVKSVSSTFKSALPFFKYFDVVIAESGKKI